MSNHTRQQQSTGHFQIGGLYTLNGQSRRYLRRQL